MGISGCEYGADCRARYGRMSALLREIRRHRAERLHGVGPRRIMHRRGHGGTTGYETRPICTVKPRYILLTIFYCAGIFYLSSESDPIGVEMPFPGMDKLLHMVMYGGLATVVSFGISRSGSPVSHRVQFLAPIVFAGVYGLSDEIHQMFVPRRDFDPLDVVADLAGALLIQTILWFGSRRTRE